MLRLRGWRETSLERPRRECGRWCGPVMGAAGIICSYHSARTSRTGPASVLEAYRSPRVLDEQHGLHRDALEFATTTSAGVNFVYGKAGFEHAIITD